MRDDLRDEQTISKEHIKNNTDVRNLLATKNIYPESLPPTEDIKKVERKISLENKKIIKEVK